MRFNIEKHTCYLTKHGSHAYGTNIATSDIDHRGIAIPPKEYFFGFSHKFEQQEQIASNSSDKDEVIFDIRKFFKLASECNPNVIEIIHTDPSDIIYINDIGLSIVENRELFLSKRVRDTFMGYAHAQLKRIKTHRNWLLTPPSSRPMRSEFGLSEKNNEIVNKSTLGAVNYLIESGEHNLSSSIMEVVHREKQYNSALQHWNQYNSWKESRNKARAELEAKFGYDTKHAMHLIRLMRMCVEIIDGKGVNVRRPDAQELLEIRHGIWSYERLIEEAEALEKLSKERIEVSSLPSKVDYNKLDALCVELVERHLFNNR